MVDQHQENYRIRINLQDVLSHLLKAKGTIRKLWNEKQSRELMAINDKISDVQACVCTEMARVSK